MANLYWWETGYRTEDADTGVDLGSTISYSFGFIIVVVLSMITVNMFVAVITNEFGTAREGEAMRPFEEKQATVKVKVTALRPVSGLTPWPDEAEPVIEMDATGNTTIAQLKFLFQHRYLKNSMQDKQINMFSLKESTDPSAPDPDSSPSVRSKELDNEQRICTFIQAQGENGLARKIDDDDVPQVHVYTFTSGELMEWCDTVVDTENFEKGEDNDGTTKFYTATPSTPPTPGENKIVPMGRTGGRPQEQGLRQLVLHGPPPCYQSKWCANLITKSYFDNFIMCFILMNTTTLASEHFNQSENFTIILDNIGHVFNFVFTFELIFKVFGMGFDNYITIPFNKLGEIPFRLLHCAHCFLCSPSLW
jgi:hypothetical protein